MPARLIFRAGGPAGDLEAVLFSKKPLAYTLQHGAQANMCPDFVSMYGLLIRTASNAAVLRYRFGLISNQEKHLDIDAVR